MAFNSAVSSTSVTALASNPSTRVFQASTGGLTYAADLFCVEVAFTDMHYVMQDVLCFHRVINYLVACAGMK